MILLDRFGVTIPMLVQLREDLPKIMDLLHFCLTQFDEVQDDEDKRNENQDGAAGTAGVDLLRKRRGG